MMRRGFTLVEMLIVIAVIGVLGGIITTAAVGAIKNGRSKRADAMCVALEQGIAAYYAQEGKWPEAIENRASSMTEATYTFSQDEADSIFQDVVFHLFFRKYAAKCRKSGFRSLFFRTVGESRF